MARIRSRWSSVLIAAAVLAIAGVATAMAQSSAPGSTADRSVAVIGTGEAKPTPEDPKSNASIVKAVRDAEREAIPNAIGNGKGRAARLAKLTDMTLVDLKSVEETSPSPFGPVIAFGGSFGPDRYCATVRRPVYKRDSNGKRRRAGTRSVRRCSVPPTVRVSLKMTFSAN